MKWILGAGLVLGLLGSAWAAAPVVPPPPPATQAEVNAGLATRPYVSPATLAGLGGLYATNGITGNQFTQYFQANIVAGVLSNVAAGAITASNAVLATTASTATNVVDATGRAMAGAFLEPIDTNTFYVVESINTNAGASMFLQGNFAGYGGRYIRSGATFIPYAAQTISVIYKTNLGQGVWAMIDRAGSAGNQDLPMFWLTNSDDNLTMPIGAGWYSDVDNLDANIGYSARLASKTILQPTNTVPLAQESYRATQNRNPPLHTSIRGGRPVVMMVAGASGTIGSAVDLTNVFRFLTNNSLESFPDIIEVDNWVGGRDTNQNLIFSTNYMAGFTNISDFTRYIHAQGKLAALHFDMGLWLNNSGGRAGSQPFYYQDSTNAVSQGLDGCILDTTLGLSANDNDNPSAAPQVSDFINNWHSAAGLYGRPFYLMGAFNGLSANAFAAWMPSANAYTFTADTATDASLRMSLKRSMGWRGFGKYPSPANTEASAFTSSADGARNLFSLLAIGPFNLQCGTNTFTASVRAVCTNSEMKSIWFDAACNPGWLVSSNATGEVWTRLLANGDYAVMFDNISGSAASMTVDWRSLGIETNITLVCRDVFERTNITADTTLTTTVPKTSLWRFSSKPFEVSGSGSPEGSYSGTVGCRYIRTDGAGGLYIKTNGVGNTGWYNLLTHGP